MISFGCAIRPRKVRSRIARFTSSPFAAAIAVSKRPGTMTLTRTPRLPELCGERACDAPDGSLCARVRRDEGVAGDARGGADVDHRAPRGEKRHQLGDGDHHGTLVDAVKEIDVVQRKLVHGATTVDPRVVHDHRTRAVEPRASVLIRAARSISPHERVGSGPDVDRQPGRRDSAPGAPAGSHQEAATHLAQQRQVAGSPGRMPLWASSAAG